MPSPPASVDALPSASAYAPLQYHFDGDKHVYYASQAAHDTLTGRGSTQVNMPPHGPLVANPLRKHAPRRVGQDGPIVAIGSRLPAARTVAAAGTAPSHASEGRNPLKNPNEPVLASVYKTGSPEQKKSSEQGNASGSQAIAEDRSVYRTPVMSNEMASRDSLGSLGKPASQRYRRTSSMPPSRQMGHPRSA